MIQDQYKYYILMKFYLYKFETIIELKASFF